MKDYVIPFVNAHFNVSQNPDGRAIAMLSLGGLMANYRCRGQGGRAERPIYCQMRSLSRRLKKIKVWNGPWFHPLPTP